jgi:hypothetical protein
MTKEQLAILFHETYERLAPSFHYSTRHLTRQFDPTSPNGHLMIAVCGEVLERLGVEPTPDLGLSETGFPPQDLSPVGLLMVTCYECDQCKVLTPITRETCCGCGAALNRTPST